MIVEHLALKVADDHVASRRSGSSSSETLAPDGRAPLRWRAAFVPFCTDAHTGQDRNGSVIFVSADVDYPRLYRSMTGAAHHGCGKRPGNTWSKAGEKMKVTKTPDLIVA
jgi:hypothetical protein